MRWRQISSIARCDRYAWRRGRQARVRKYITPYLRASIRQRTSAGPGTRTSGVSARSPSSISCRLGGFSPAVLPVRATVRGPATVRGRDSALTSCHMNTALASKCLYTHQRSHPRCRTPAEYMLAQAEQFTNSHTLVRWTRPRESIGTVTSPCVHHRTTNANSRTFTEDAVRACPHPPISSQAQQAPRNARVHVGPTRPRPRADGPNRLLQPLFAATANDHISPPSTIPDPSSLPRAAVPPRANPKKRPGRPPVSCASPQGGRGRPTK
ncbi:hypothetical protein BD413DRAFT_268191 [Trametes elegans]|nr:hypothetical protein BD413DRAFT_268191 [Trametes elegans]